MKNFEKIINTAWDRKEKISQNSHISIIKTINQIIDLLDQGKIRVSEKKNNEWTVNQWIKKAVLLIFSFKTQMKAYKRSIHYLV